MLRRIQPILAEGSEIIVIRIRNRREQPTQPDQHVVPLPIVANLVQIEEEILRMRMSELPKTFEGLLGIPLHNIKMRPSRK